VYTELFTYTVGTGKQNKNISGNHSFHWNIDNQGNRGKISNKERISLKVRVFFGRF
jgi:hypothetical protein